MYKAESVFLDYLCTATFFRYICYTGIPNMVIVIEFFLISFRFIFCISIYGYFQQSVFHRMSGSKHLV